MASVWRAVVAAPEGSPMHGRYAVTPPRAAPPSLATDQHPAGLRTDRRPAELAVGLDDLLVELSAGEAAGTRWVCWSAAAVLPPIVARGLRPARLWDVAEAHRLLAGGWRADPGVAHALAHGLPIGEVPAPTGGDLFDLVSLEGQDEESLVTAGGFLRPDAVSGTWLTSPARLALWAESALETALRQLALLRAHDPRGELTAYAESAAALMCVELEHDGLPVDRTEAERLIAEAAGPRPVDEVDARRIRAARDQVVLAHVPDGRTTDLRNPAAVKDMLARAGVDVPTTRKWVLEAYRDSHPVVADLLAWRADERVATTYGYGWLDAHVGADDRLRGAWTACDGAAGRMTAQNGLHNLPVGLRPAVAATEGHVLVRADLGQIEPRVLAAVSGDAAFAAATRADDLYAPVASRLGVERPVAKVAVLAAMYGQRSGAAGEALKGLERAYPVAMAHLDRAYAAGTQGEPVRTFGGRVVPTDFRAAERPVGADPAMDGARGRFARNAVIQGSAAELFKAWAVTVRARLPEGSRIVLCLHDELLVHARAADADAVSALLHTCLDEAAHRWVGSDRVRFVADVAVVQRWSQAKG